MNKWDRDDPAHAQSWSKADAVMMHCAKCYATDAERLCKLGRGSLTWSLVSGRTFEQVTAMLRHEENVATIEGNSMGKSLPGGGLAHLRAQRP